MTSLAACHFHPCNSQPRDKLTLGLEHAGTLDALDWCSLRLDGDVAESCLLVDSSLLSTFNSHSKVTLHHSSSLCFQTLGPSISLFTSIITMEGMSPYCPIYFSGKHSQRKKFSCLPQFPEAPRSQLVHTHLCQMLGNSKQWCPDGSAPFRYDSQKARKVQVLFIVQFFTAKNIYTSSPTILQCQVQSPLPLLETSTHRSSLFLFFSY